MRRGIFPLLWTVAFLLAAHGHAAPSFDDCFIDSTMRIDYYHIGNASEEVLTIDHIYRQGVWAGSTTHLLDPLENGRYDIKVYDVASNDLLYSRGYDSYFGEYKTTTPAKEGVQRTFHESVLIPFPRRPVLVVFACRDKKNIFHPLYTRQIDPHDYSIDTGNPRRGDTVYEALINGSPHDHVDVAIIGEGYTLKEKSKFEKDLNRYTGVLFSMEPYKSFKGRFNVRGIFTPSPESGVDEPRQGIFRNTALGASFNALDEDRYLLVEDNRTLRNVAAQVPYDVMMVMVNSARYGGGGFYGYYSDFTADDRMSEYVFQHEFGHAFGGLADEYYTSDVTYNEFYPPGVEPTEPNITALLDPARLKWRALVTPGIAIPTEWGQQEFDSLNAVRDSVAHEEGAALSVLKGRGASDDDIGKARAAFTARLREIYARISGFMENHPLRGKIGAFQGGGYIPKGIYRPTVNSIMNQFDAQDKDFYNVNEEAIVRVIKYYTE